MSEPKLTPELLEAVAVAKFLYSKKIEQLTAEVGAIKKTHEQYRKDAIAYARKADKQISDLTAEAEGLKRVINYSSMDYIRKLEARITEQAKEIARLRMATDKPRVLDYVDTVLEQQAQISDLRAALERTKPVIKHLTKTKCECDPDVGICPCDICDILAEVSKVLKEIQ